VVVVYDDLSNHAHAHRSLALLLGRPVGREAHPVDVFYAHARLLERSAQFGARRRGGSLTAFPIIETQAGDLTGYIPTNLVSITDGQVRLDAALAASGLRPAVDIALSVSRVGGKAQPKLVRALAGSFKNRYAQFLELESFARFGTRLEASAQELVDWGRRARSVLQQDRGEARSWAETVARMLLVDDPRFARLPLERTGELIAEGAKALIAEPGFDAASIDNGRAGPGDAERLRKLAMVVLGRLVDRAKIDMSEGAEEDADEGDKGEVEVVGAEDPAEAGVTPPPEDPQPGAQP
jgi:F-type H+-transporting ATPase subunit alpha